MSYPAVFCVKLQLHFGGDVHEITVPAYGGAEPTVTDLMNAVERDFRVPRALQNLVFHGQELHVRSNEPLSRFGIKNGGAVRLVGRMAPPDLINQINAQNNSYSYPQSYYIQQPYTIPTYQTNEQSIPYYSEQFQYAPNSSVSTQYDPPPPPTPPNKIQPPPTPQNNTQPPPPPPTPNQGQTSERSNGQEQKPPAAPNSSNTK
jgi:hypothetical protein